MAKLDAAKKEVLDLQGRSIRYSILKRDVDTNRSLYDGLLQRLKEVGVAGGVGRQQHLGRRQGAGSARPVQAQPDAAT